MKKSNKKGSIIDLIFIAVGLVIFGASVLLAFKIMDEFNTNIQANPDIPAEGKAASTELRGDFPGILDKTYLFLCIGLAIGAFILASLVRVHPIFFVFYIIALLFVIFIAGIFSNIYQTMAENPALASQASELTSITLTLTYLPMIVGVFGTILAVVMFKLWSNEQV